MKKKVVAVLLSTVMALSMAGCGNGGQESNSSSANGGGNQTDANADANAGADANADSNAGGDYTFEVLVKSFQSTYWQAAVQGIEKACSELGVKANSNGPANESDIADQIQMIDDAIEKKPDGIGLAACDANSVIDSLAKASQAGIPVVCFDTGVDGAPEGAVYATVATDNAAAGAVAAENMFPVIEGKIKAATTDAPVRIGEVNQDATGLNIQQRGKGFIDKMIELCKSVDKKVAVVGNEFYVK